MVDATRRLLERQRKHFVSGYSNYGNRISRLKKLYESIKSNEDHIIDALYSDLRKSSEEAYITEIGYVLDEISHMMKHLRSWMRPEKVRNTLRIPFSSSKIIHEPYGQVLIMSPWNYPFGLAMSPLAGAIAAGNTCIIKPSEISKNTSKIIARIISENFNEEEIAVVEGGPSVAKKLTSLEFDNVFFTGSPMIGREVLKATSQNLIPTTLELGGKSPCYVSRGADLDLAAERIVFGKFINAGQTCIAPDYVLVDSDIYDDLADKIISKIDDSYASGRYLARIINKKNFDRLTSMLDDVDIFYGGYYSSKDLTISPTLVRDPSLDHSLMREEIFGPILPILPVSSFEEGVSIIRERPKPLASYVFSKDKDIADRFISEVSSGGSCINDTILHLSNLNLPFGGVGNSGIGRYRGRYSFENFSNLHTVYDSPRLRFPRRLPPYGNKMISVLKKMLR